MTTGAVITLVVAQVSVTIVAAYFIMKVSMVRSKKKEAGYSKTKE